MTTTDLNLFYHHKSSGMECQMGSYRCGISGAFFYQVAAFDLLTCCQLRVPSMPIALTTSSTRRIETPPPSTGRRPGSMRARRAGAARAASRGRRSPTATWGLPPQWCPRGQPAPGQYPLPEWTLAPLRSRARFAGANRSSNFRNTDRTRLRRAVASARWPTLRGVGSPPDLEPVLDGAKAGPRPPGSAGRTSIALEPQRQQG
jgi:hypothetical protein